MSTAARTRLLKGKNTFSNRPKATRKDKQQDKRIKKLENVVNTRELKYQDVSATAQTPTYAGVVVNLFGPNQGSSDVTHIGDKVAIERIRFRMNFGQIVAGSTNQVRVMIIRDKANNIGTVPGNILEGAYLSTPNAAQAPYEEDLRKNYEVLYDRTYLVDDQHKQSQIIVDRRWRRPKLVQFNANTTTVNSGQLKLLLCTDQLAGNTGIDYVSRVWYSDL